MGMTADRIREFARRYTEAWCSHDPDAVASFYAEDGRIVINGGEPSAGRGQIAEMVRGFVEAFPDLVVKMDLRGRPEATAYTCGRSRARTPDRTAPATASRSPAGSTGASATTAWWRNRPGTSMPGSTSASSPAAEGVRTLTARLCATSALAVLALASTPPSLPGDGVRRPGGARGVDGAPGGPGRVRGDAGPHLGGGCRGGGGPRVAGGVSRRRGRAPAPRRPRRARGRSRRARRRGR